MNFTNIAALANIRNKLSQGAQAKLDPLIIQLEAAGGTGLPAVQRYSPLKSLRRLFPAASASQLAVLVFFALGDCELLPAVQPQENGLVNMSEVQQIATLIGGDGQTNFLIALLNVLRNSAALDAAIVSNLK